MKKLILMTSALTLAGGTAFAGAHGGGEITIGAEASVAYGNWDGAAAAMSYNANATATLAGSAGDVSYGGSVTVDSDDGVTVGEIFVSTMYGRFAFDMDAYDATLATEEDGDISYSGDFGDFGLTAVVDADAQAWIVGASTSMGGVNAGVKFDSDNAWEVNADTTVGGVTVGATFDSGNAWEVTASTTVGGLDVNASYDDAGDWSVGAGSTTGGVTWDASYDSAGDIAANAAMSFGDTAVSIAYDSANAGGTGDDAEIVGKVTHTVGGLVLHAQANDQSEYEIGATASFSF